MRRLVPLAAVLAAASVSAGCAEDITGPTPVLASPTRGSPLPVDPGVVCRDQLTTRVTVTGAGFSPLPVDLAHTPATWLPSVRLTRAATLAGGAGDGLEVHWDGRPGDDAANGDALAWESASALSFEVRPTMTLVDGAVAPLPDGVFDVTVTNANGAAATSSRALALVPEPELAAASPNLVCLAQGPRTVTLTGTGFLRLDGADARLAIDDVDAALPLGAFTGCVDIPHPGVEAELCSGADVVLAQDSVPLGEHGLTIQNPETAACTSQDDIRLRVVPPPVVERVEPPAECTAEATQDVTIVGTGLLEVDGTLPGVTLDGAAITSVGVDGCEDLPTQGHTVRACTRLTVTIPVESPAAPRRPTLVVTNPEPAGCTGSTATALVLVPPPTVDDVQPPVVCDDGADQVLRFSGTWYFTVDGAPPTVTADEVALPAARVSAVDCSDVGVPGLAVMGCTGLDVTVNPSDVVGGEVDFAVTNPEPVACGDAYPIAIPLVDPPTITAAAPSLVCTDDGARAITITGDGFMRVGAALPGVLLDGAPATVEAVGGCTPAGIPTVPSAERCTSIDVTAAAGALEPGPVTVTVTSAAPVGCGSVSDVLVVPPRLVIDHVEPDSVCTIAGDQTITIHGAGFTEIDGVGPSVTLAGAAFALDGPPSDCVDVVAPGHVVRSCGALAVRVPAGTLAEGDIAVAVTNPAPDGCAETATGIFYSVPVPDVTSVLPTAFCSEQGGVLTVRGARFAPTATVALQSAGGPRAAGVVTWVAADELSVDFGPDIPPGVYDVVVANAEGCEDRLPLAVEVHPNPLVFFVDPPVVYNGITIEATVYLSGLEEAAAEVALLGPGGEVEVVAGTSAADQPNRITIKLREGLAPGAWAVRVTSAIGCVGALDGAFTVTDRLTFTIDAVDPAFVWTGRGTPITITADGGGFVKTPRAYLNPKDAPAGTPATNLRATLFDAATTLTGVVPAGLAADQEYELIVVNPDGTVGLFDAVTVTAEPPPVVTAILPGSLDAQSGARATIVGQDFATAGMTATMTCRTTGGAVVGPLTVAPVAGTLTATSFEAAFPADQGGAGSACIVTVVHPSGASFRYSAISIKTPAQNLNDFVDAGTQLTVPRRALGLVAGRPTTQSRYLYAIGGDGGATSSALATVEAASVSLFGEIGAFAPQRHALPGARTFVGTTRIGRFVYAVGGHDGTNPVATVLRAPILDPLATPEVVDVGVTLLDAADERPGVAAGLWIYRIAAEFPDDDPIDPGGESLPGEPLVVQLPDVPGLALTLAWDAIPGASGYRVYRTPSPDLGVDAVELLATTDAATRAFQDAGALATIAAETPLPPGSLGVWSLAGTLGTTRAAPAVAAAWHPTDPTVAFLYAFGGRKAAPGAGPVDTWERATVALVPAAGPKERERHGALTFVAGADTLDAARAEAAAFVVTSADVKQGVAPGRTWIYIGPGRGAASTVDALEAGYVLPDGGLGNAAGTPGLVTIDKSPGGDAGYGVGIANGFLFMFGGAGGSASSGGISAELCLGLGGCSPSDVMPNVKNWNAGIAVQVPRVFAGSTQESAFFFLAGGFDGTAVSRSVRATVQ